MKKLSKKEQVERMRQYEVHGIPHFQLKPMCRAVGISYPKLMKELRGQTGTLIGNVPFTYAADIERFILGLPNLD